MASRSTPASRSLRWLLPAVASLGFGLAGTGSVRAIDDTGLKAAIVYNLLGFVDWPAPASPPAGAELVLCVDPQSATAGPLRLLAGRPVGSAPLAVRMLDAGRGAGGCHALLIDGSTRDIAGLLRGRASDAMLVIADRPRATDDGAHLHLAPGNGRIAFELSLAPARRSGLQFSARLLRLARAVHE